VKIEMNIKQTVDVKFLFADMGVRYWEDGVVNGQVDDDDNPQMPKAENGRWKLTINLETGAVIGWPRGTTASVHYKVCDDGEYALLEGDGKVVKKIDGYVPSMLAPDGDGYGDYVILSIDAEGLISNWKADLSCFDNA
jgi:hypothetical protein